MSTKAKSAIKEWASLILTVLALAGFVWEARGYVQEVKEVSEKINQYEEVVKEVISLRERISTLEEHKRNCSICNR